LFSIFCCFVVGFASSNDGGSEDIPYSQTFANYSLMFAYGAYCSSSSIQAWNCKWCQYVSGFEVSSVIVKDDLQAFVGYDTKEKQIVVSFRGSSNLIDWLDDLTYTLIPYPWVSGGEIHEGFYLAWGEISKEVMDATTALMSKYSGSTILVTGHSLGAALAQIAALNFTRYAESTKNSATVLTYTFGSPRWGNINVADYFGSLIGTNWRLVNVHDIVPTVPPQSFGFHHTWTEIWYTSDSPLEYTQCDGSGEDPACSYVITSVEDHLWYLDLYEQC